MTFAERLKAITTEIRQNEPMSEHTTIKAGGPADYYVPSCPASAVAAIVRLCNEAGKPYFILGNGSNVLFKDNGFRGVVIGCRGLAGISFTGGTVTAGAGVHLKDLCAALAERGLSGPERLCGIPGSVGGAVYMNAGAYEDETSNHVISVTALNAQGDELTLTNAQMAFSYRMSAARRDGLIVLSAGFKATQKDPAEIKAAIADMNRRRAEKQPLDEPSAGSAFKRPKDNFAGKLIMDAGLRGFRLGGAKVSEKHCGFIVNNGGSASDVLALIEHIQNEVYAQFGVMLEPEIRIVGE